MGLMLNGTYLVDDPGPDTREGGEFQRAKSTLRDLITPDGRLTPDIGRYHVYAAWNCPWAHRVLLARAILRLENKISVAVAKPRRTDQGWVFDPSGDYADPELSALSLHQVYSRQTPAYTGRITVPVLWDRKTNHIVSNESADIIRMLGAFGGPDLYPDALRKDIDAWNARIYPGLNNGVYRTGFARTQEAYEKGFNDVFETLDAMETQLSQTRYLTGDTFTEADLRAFPTLARFDVAYHYAFKCNLRKLVDYPNLWAYAREIYAMPGVAETVKFDIYKQGYFSPSELRNPLGIVPLGPELADWHAPHGRDHITL